MADLSTRVVNLAADPKTTFTFDYTTVRLSNTQVKYTITCTGVITAKGGWYGTGSTCGMTLYISMAGQDKSVVFKDPYTRWEGSTPKTVTLSFTINESTGSGTKAITKCTMTSSYFGTMIADSSAYTVTVPGLLSAPSDITSSVNYAFGGMLPITITEKTSGIGYNYDITVKVNNITVKTVTGITSTVYSMSLSSVHSDMYAAIPDKLTGTIAVYLTTKLGSTTVGQTYKTGVITIPNSCTPTFTSASYADTNATTLAATGNAAIIIQGYSNIRVTAAVATSNYSAHIVKYTVKTGTSTFESTTNVINNVIVSSTDNKLIVSAVDDRGLSTSVTLVMTLINYQPIKLFTAQASRLSSLSPYANLYLTGSWSPFTITASLKNSIAGAQYRYRTAASISGPAGSWSAFTGIQSSVTANTTTGALSINIAQLVNEFSIDYAYDIEVQLHDNITSLNTTVYLSSAIIALSLMKGKVGVGRDPVSERLGVAGDVIIDGKLNGDEILRQIACVIRNSAGTWGFISDNGHAAVNCSNIAMAPDSVTFGFSFNASKVGSLIVTTDETLAKYGLTVGASVGTSSATIKMYMPFSCLVSGSGTISDIPAFFGSSVSIAAIGDSSGFIITHPAAITGDAPVVTSVRNSGTMDGQEIRAAYSTTTITLRAYSALSGYITYNGSAWTVATDNIDKPTMSFNATTGALTVTYGKRPPTPYSIVVTSRDGALIPVLGSISTSNFIVYFKDWAGATVLAANTNMKFFFTSGEKVPTTWSSSNSVLVRRGSMLLNPANVIDAGGNLWIYGVMHA